jgi:hypothetical protein
VSENKYLKDVINYITINKFSSILNSESFRDSPGGRGKGRGLRIAQFR